MEGLCSSQESDLVEVLMDNESHIRRKYQSDLLQVKKLKLEALAKLQSDLEKEHSELTKEFFEAQEQAKSVYLEATDAAIKVNKKNSVYSDYIEKSSKETFITNEIGKLRTQLMENNSSTDNKLTPFYKFRSEIKEFSDKIEANEKSVTANIEIGKKLAIEITNLETEEFRSKTINLNKELDATKNEIINLENEMNQELKKYDEEIEPIQNEIIKSQKEIEELEKLTKRHEEDQENKIVNLNKVEIE